MKRTTGRHAKFLFCNLGKQEQNGADDILDCRCHGTRFNPLKRCYLIFTLYRNDELDAAVKQAGVRSVVSKQDGIVSLLEAIDAELRQATSH
jgi:hypothetical protein